MSNVKIPAYVFDIWETLADTPQWEDLLKNDPTISALFEAAKTDVPSKRALVAIFDEKVRTGDITIQEAPGARQVLEKLLLEKGPVVGYSSGSDFTNKALLEGANLSQYFMNRGTVISDADTLGVSKADPAGYARLIAYLDKHGMRAESFTDNTLKNIEAAHKSGVGIPSLYHFDRKPSGLIVPEQKEGYVRIARLDQIRELRQ